MSLLQTLRNEWIFVTAALRTLNRIKHIHPDSSKTVADYLEESARKYPKNIAIYYENQALTYADLGAAANQYARWANANGIHKGASVALLMENRPEFIIAWFGLAKIGVIAALMNTNLRSHALAHCINLSKASHVILGAECAEAYESAEEFLDQKLTPWATGGLVPGAKNLDQVLSSQSGGPLAENVRAGLRAKDICFYIYTSGTTGLPKAAKLSHSRVATAMNGFSAASNASQKDRMYIALPLYHSAGGVAAVGTTLTVGGAVILARKFSARRFWADCVRYQATLFQYIGEFCRYLLLAEPCKDETRHSLRSAAGNGLRPDIWEEFQQRFKLPHILEFYASTEGNVALLNYDGKEGSIGRAPKYLKHRYPYVLVEFDFETEEPIRNEQGHCMECPVDGVGELIAKIIMDDPRGRFDGYSTKEETERKILRNVFEPGDAWFRTGDLMRKDARDYFYFVDRIGDTFRWKGENVATNEVSEIISQFPGVRESNVYGVEIPKTDGRAGMASLVISHDFDLAGFYNYVVNELPDYARPIFLRVQEEVEITTTFKHKKVDLVKEGFDPRLIQDQMLVLLPDEAGYQELDASVYDQIVAGAFRF